MKKEQKEGSKTRTHYSSAQFYDKRHPRAAVGTDEDGNIYYVVIDGRFKGKADGASIYETAYICKMLGMTQAINLDGGGSTTLWSEQTGVLNHPHDNRKWDHDGERAVPNLISPTNTLSTSNLRNTPAPQRTQAYYIRHCMSNR